MLTGKLLACSTNLISPDVVVTSLGCCDNPRLVLKIRIGVVGLRMSEDHQESATMLYLYLFRRPMSINGQTSPSPSLLRQRPTRLVNFGFLAFIHSLTTLSFLRYTPSSQDALEPLFRLHPCPCNPGFGAPCPFTRKSSPRHRSARLRRRPTPQAFQQREMVFL